MQVLADDGFNIMRRSRVVKYLFADDIRVECFCAGWDYSCIEPCVRQGCVHRWIGVTRSKHWEERPAVQVVRKVVIPTKAVTHSRSCLRDWGPPSKFAQTPRSERAQCLGQSDTVKRRRKAPRGHPRASAVNFEEPSATQRSDLAQGKGRYGAEHVYLATAMWQATLVG